jgi:ERCC4-type nuclease
MRIDSREAATHPKHVGYLERFFTVEVETMQFGDYAWVGADMPEPGCESPSYGLEASTVSDVLGKIRSNRLAYQMSGMLSTYDFSILLVIGKLYTDKKGNLQIPGTSVTFSRAAFDSIMFSAGLHGVTVQYADSRADALRRIALNIQYTDRPFAEHKTFRVIRPKASLKMPLGEPANDLVQGLMSVAPEGIGESMCEVALEHYGSVLNVVSANRTMLHALPGWGQRTAEDFYNHVRKEIKQMPAQCTLCSDEVNDEDFCHGCNEYICDKHLGDAPFGSHAASDHEEEDEDVS